MQFTKLRLSGFKSFVEPTDFVIHPGLTGIVGPNGCGKSNLVEALRWVMGENSAKRMRGTGMDDMIFAGTATRPARNIAEVTLTLDNKTRTAPAAFNEMEEVAITRKIERASDAGTAFDGKHLYQIAEARIDKIDPATGSVVASIPAPGKGNDSGLAWAEGSLWVGQYRDRKIHQIDPETGAIRRTIESNRFVTGVTWVDGELWHGTWEGDESELRRVDPATGEVLDALALPSGVNVSGLASDGADRFYCGGGGTGKVCAVRRPGSGS